MIDWCLSTLFEVLFFLEEMWNYEKPREAYGPIPGRIGMGYENVLQ